MLIVRYSGHCGILTCEPPALDLLMFKVNKTFRRSWLEHSEKNIKGVKTKPMC